MTEEHFLFLCFIIFVIVVWIVIVDIVKERRFRKRWDSPEAEGHD